MNSDFLKETDLGGLICYRSLNGLDGNVLAEEGALVDDTHSSPANHIFLVVLYTGVVQEVF